MNDENTIPEEAENEAAEQPERLDPWKAAEQGETDPAAEAAAEAPPPEPEPAQAQLLRLRADFDNYRKRTEREKGEWTVRANERLIESILPALDTFELGLADAEQNDAKQSVVEGFRMVQTMLLDTLQRSGLTPVDAVGQPFDPNQHEAINRMPSEEVAADHVLFQSRRGYVLGDKLIRPAQVVVSTGSADAAAESQSAEESPEA